MCGVLHGWPPDHRYEASCLEPIFERRTGWKRIYPDLPALILLGRQDAVVGYRDAWRIIENYPRATFAILDRTGHFLTVEQQALYSTLVNEWLDRVEESARAA
jgi:pimeloyl-ACP methyl ester carboxylesterase